MDKKKMLETTAMVFGVGVFIGAVWFWSLQVDDVLEILEMAYGQTRRIASSSPSRQGC